MHKMMMELEKMKKSKETLENWLCSEIEKGKECYDVAAAGMVTDQIKDLSEACEKCVKAKYYELLICSMLNDDYDHDDEENERAGYDNWRYSSGRFAPKGRGTNVGHGTNIRMGYPITPHTHPGAEPVPIRGGDRMKGTAYDDYWMAKMGYTESHSDKDHREMNDRIMKAVMETSEDMKEMWNDASPDTRIRMKSNLSSLLKDWEKV